MAVNLDDLFRRGGRDLVDFLEHSVFGMNMDLVFLFLVGEYQMAPTAQRAVALFDVFCAETSPARISVLEAVPPRNLQLKQVVSALREPEAPPAADETPSEAPEDSVGADPPPNNPVWIPRTAPGKFVFDTCAQKVRTLSRQVQQVRDNYNPDLSSVENLPGGVMTAAQKAFVENTWGPRVRPHLVGSGFLRIANIA